MIVCSGQDAMGKESQGHFLYPEESHLKVYLVETNYKSGANNKHKEGSVVQGRNLQFF